ncbi:MAG: 50S ribosomal protein L18e [Candidatus Micrarchaeota archaeon]|nr:MAG: 50S ribosomal protein L18e [Candidatus Micrarchaeota archaeon]
MRTRAENPEYLKIYEAFRNEYKSRVINNKKIGYIKRALKLLNRSRRSRLGVNLYKIDKYTKENDYVFVPDKLLAVGKLNHPVKVLALSYSSKALEELKRSGSEILDVERFLKEAKGVKIII